MNTQKVRVNSKYIFDPVFWDYDNSSLITGDCVRVVNRFGCPRANTNGHCYVNIVDPNTGKETFAGLVCTNSLIPIKEIDNFSHVPPAIRRHFGVRGISIDKSGLDYVYNILYHFDDTLTPEKPNSFVLDGYVCMESSPFKRADSPNGVKVVSWNESPEN